MDVEVEMVNSNKISTPLKALSNVVGVGSIQNHGGGVHYDDGVVAVAEDLDEYADYENNPIRTVKQQNRVAANKCVVSCTVLMALLFVAVAIVGKVYLSPSELSTLTVGEESYTAQHDQGADNVVYNSDSSTAGVKQAFDHLHKHKKHLPTYMNGTSSAGSGSNNNHEKEAMGGMDRNPPLDETDGGTLPPPNKNKKSKPQEQQPTQTDAEEPAANTPDTVLEHATVAAWQAAKVTLADGIKYEIVEQIEHDKNDFIEGLVYVNGTLYESTGLTGQSKLKQLDPDTGRTIRSWNMPSQYFGEGLTHAHGKLIQLTYKARKGFVYDISDLQASTSSTPAVTEFTFSSTTNEGWGLTYDFDKNELIMSDGSSYLHFWDPVTFQFIRKLQVHRQDGSPASMMNELEYWRGYVLANIWYQDNILVIDKESGQAVKEYAFGDLYPQGQRRKDNADVLNGIATTGDPDILYVTGKCWDRMFKIRLNY